MEDNVDSSVSVVRDEPAFLCSHSEYLLQYSKSIIVEIYIHWFIKCSVQ